MSLKRWMFQQGGQGSWQLALMVGRCGATFDGSFGGKVVINTGVKGQCEFQAAV